MAFQCNNKKVLVLGLGISGRAAARLLLRNGAHVWGVDRNADLLLQNEQIAALREEGLTTSCEGQKIDIDSFDFAVVSPGIPQSNPVYAEVQKLGLEVLGEVELACRFVTQKFLGITGTNGKTTVTLLVAHVLNQAGICARAVGNVGVPLAAEVEAFFPTKTHDIMVAELSSFQLDTLQSRVIDVGVVLNITPDHLDRYDGMTAYAASKMHIQDCLKPGGVLYMEEAAYMKYGYLLRAKPRLYGFNSNCDIYCDGVHVIVNGQVEYILPVDYRNKFSHDVENLMAAYALCREMGVLPEQFARAYATFSKPAHRIEFVRTINEVSYYDDSKGTNVDAVIRAVASLKGPVILIAGGLDKGSSYAPWIDTFRGKVKGICTIGQAAPKMKQELEEAFPLEIFATLDDAVKAASHAAVPGDNVLLSPGCSSYDMFRDYAHRGDEFKRIVSTLMDEKVYN